MRSRLTTALLVVGLVVFAASGAYAASANLGLAKAHHGKARHHKKKKGRRHHNGATPTQTQASNGQSSAQSQYGTRPGKGCGDRNHTHTGPPGNPSNTSCPHQSQHQGTTTSLATGHKSGHHARHHSRKKHGKKK
jgi:hypothetical protein